MRRKSAAAERHWETEHGGIVRGKTHRPVSIEPAAGRAGEREAFAIEPGTRSVIAQGWRALGLLNTFRFALVLLLTPLTALRSPEVSAQIPGVLQGALLLYFLLAGLWAITLSARRPSLKIQSRAQLLLDVAVLSVIIVAGRGYGSGLSVVMLMPVAVAGMVMPRRGAEFTAALATFGLLTGEVIDHLLLGSPPAYTQAGAIALMGFIATLSMNFLASRLDESARLAEQRAKDVRELSRLNDLVIQNIHNGILVVDPNGTVKLSNHRADELLLPAKHQAAGYSLSAVSPALDELLGRWEQGRLPSDPTFTGADGHSDLYPSFARLGERDRGDILIFLEEAREVKQRMQAMKLSALGRLTASIAHEIRNPLSAVRHAAQLLDESGDVNADDRQLLRIIDNHSMRIEGIVQDILQLSRQPTAQPQWLDLSQWLLEFEHRYREPRPELPGDLTVAPPVTGLVVQMDPGHLMQVVENLVDNAFLHALPAAGPVRVWVRAGKSGGIGRAQLDIMDNGQGIDEQSQERLFEPFYTTSHKGTGLGLFIARELCEFNGVQLHYIQLERGGSCFRLSLPSAKG